VTFDETILGLTTGRSSIDDHTMRPEKMVYGATEETGIEVTLNALGYAAGIDEEHPECIDDVFTGGRREPVYPGVAGGGIDQEEAVLVTAGGFSITIADIHAYAV